MKEDLRNKSVNELTLRVINTNALFMLRKSYVLLKVINGLFLYSYDQLEDLTSYLIKEVDNA